MGEPVPAGSPLWSIGAAATRCGHYCWLENRLFALTGSRASGAAGGAEPAGGADAELRVQLAEMSSHHGFLAAQWADRLPVRAGVDVAALVVPPPGPLAEALDQLEAEPDLLLVLAGLVDPILPRLAESYADHLAGSSPVRDGPVRAVLELAGARGAHEIRRARAVLARVQGPGEGAIGVAECRAGLQRLLGAAAGILPAARPS
jgi:hypothetical protein